MGVLMGVLVLPGELVSHCRLNLYASELMEATGHQQASKNAA